MHTLPTKTGTRPLARKILSGLLLGTALASAAILLGCMHGLSYSGTCVPIRLILA